MVQTQGTTLGHEQVSPSQPNLNIRRPSTGMYTRVLQRPDGLLERDGHASSVQYLLWVSEELSIEDFRDCGAVAVVHRPVEVLAQLFWGYSSGSIKTHHIVPITLGKP